MVDGIIDGIAVACRRFAKEADLAILTISRKKLMNGLILVCAVRGAEIDYGGSFKEKVTSHAVRKDAKKITADMVLDLFRTNNEVAMQFLARFDTTNILNVMY